MISWLFLIFSTVFNSTASVLVKLASNQGIESSNPLAIYLSWEFILACCLFGANLFFYAQAIKSIPLYVAYPFVTGFTIITLTLFSFFYSKEAINIIDITAIIMILGGITILSRY
tara:strand:+ start:1264 stop:1608 length:345 start_codon:yes stop_codon:yes gene_type:complete